MARVPSFKLVSVGVPVTIDSYNQLALIIDSSSSSNYVTVTNLTGEVITFVSSSTLGSDRGGGTVWGEVIIEAFGANAQVVINGDISF